MEIVNFKIDINYRSHNALSPKKHMIIINCIQRVVLRIFPFVAAKYSSENVGFKEKKSKNL
jgi:hypothetical protein